MSATARAAREVGQLPGAPTPDWASRLARVLADADPSTVAEAGVASLREGAPVWECRGSAGGSRAADLAGAAPALRRLLRPLAVTLCGNCVPTVSLLQEQLEGGAWSPRILALARRHTGALCAWTPLGRAGPDRDARRGLVLLWDEPEVARGFDPDDRRRMLSSLMPLIAERLRLALAGPGEPSLWLSMCEQRVLELLSCGLSVPEIAERLGRSQHTIHDHVKRLHRKLGTRSRGSLIARTLGYLDGPWATPPSRRPMLAFRADGRCSFAQPGGW